MLLKGAYCVGEHFVDPQRAYKPISLVCCAPMNGKKNRTYNKFYDCWIVYS